MSNNVVVILKLQLFTDRINVSENEDLEEKKLSGSGGYGSIITLNELELKIPTNDNSIIQTLQSSSYAAIFTEGIPTIIIAQ